MSAQAGAFQNWFAQTARPTVIVLGNEKGGSGKSTTAMHLIVGLMKRGHSVGSIDLDSRQASLTHYVQNRVRYAAKFGQSLELSEHQRVELQERTDSDTARDQVLRDLAEAIEGMQDCDYIVIDTPGADTFLSQLGHIIADTLITPLNDSFLDLDVLVRLDADGRNILGPSAYARMVLARASRRRDLGGPAPEWIVMRTRRAHLESRNRRDLERLLRQLGKRIGFRLAPGLSERVVYRELFTRGLTVLDVGDDATPAGRPTGASRNAARGEIHALVDLVSEGSR
jgi:chromosome partitioning protein